MEQKLLILTIILVAIILVITILNKKDLSKVVNNSKVIRDSNGDNEFFLSIIPDPSGTKDLKHQTIFVESPIDGTGDVFAISSKITKEINSIEDSLNLTFNPFSIRRLTGNNYKIINVESKQEGNTRFIDFYIKKVKYNGSNDEDSFSKNITIKNLISDQLIETRIHKQGVEPIRTRICQIRTGS